MRMYVGTVKENLDSSSLVKFTINDQYQISGSQSMVAVPMTRITKYPKSGDEILVIQPDDGVQLFYYVQCHDTDEQGKTKSVTLEYKNSSIVIKDTGEIEITSSKDALIKCNSLTVDCKNKFEVKCNSMTKLETSSAGTSIKGSSIMLNGSALGFTAGNPGVGVAASPVTSLSGGLDIR